MQVQPTTKTQPISVPTAGQTTGAEAGRAPALDGDRALFSRVVAEAKWSLDLFQHLFRPIFYPCYTLFRWVSHDDDRQKREREEHEQLAAVRRQARLHHEDRHRTEVAVRERRVIEHAALSGARAV